MQWQILPNWPPTFYSFYTYGMVWDLIDKFATFSKNAFTMYFSPSRGNFSRHFYNASSGQCEQFTYGGCQGNENNFETTEYCQGNCSGDNI